MSDDLIYRQAVTEDGEPKAVTEEYRWFHEGATAEGYDVSAVRPRPVSWALILPGDTVYLPYNYGRRGTIERFIGGDRARVSYPKGGFDQPLLADLTLVCGSPEDNPHRFGDNTNPAWRWD